MIQIDLPLPRYCSECVVRHNCIEYIHHDTQPFENGCLIKRGKKEIKQFKNKTEQRRVIETMNEILRPLLSHLNEVEQQYIIKGLEILQSIEIEKEDNNG